MKTSALFLSLGLVLVWTSSGLRAAEPAAAADVAPLMEKLKSDKPAVRIEAARTLRALTFNPEAYIPQLTDLLRDEYADVRESAAELLCRCEEKAVPALSGALKHKDYYMRYYAARSLSRLGPKAQAALAALAEAVKDSAMDVRVEASGALLKIGNASSVAVDILSGLADPNETVRQNVASVLGQAGKEILPQILKVLDSPDLNIRRAAAKAVGDMGADPQQSLPPLLRLLKDEIAIAEKDAAAKGDAGIRDSFLRHYLPDLQILPSVAKIGAPVVPEMIALLKTREDVKMRFAYDILGRMGANGKGAVPELVAILKTSQDPAQKPRAANALGSVGVGAPEALAALSETLKGGEDPLARFAALSLAKLGAIPQLIEGVKDANPKVKIVAINALATKELGAKAAAAIPALEEATKDADEKVKEAATAALKAVKPPPPAPPKPPPPPAKKDAAPAEKQQS